MRPAEPVTALTDYLLAAVYLAFALQLLRRGRAAGQRSILLAAAAFLATALSAGLGGTYHWLGGTALWKITVYCLGLAGFFLVAAAAFAASTGRARRLLLIAAGVQFAAYGTWIIGHDDFRYVIYDYALAMLATLGLFVWAARERLSRGVWWIAAAIVVTFAASGVQSSGLTLHRYFNHNDLYHVIQMGTAWLFYRGFHDCIDRALSSEPRP